ncbi:MAG: diacylglycerol/lipid kinase family protein [Gaiellales bacterium]
MADSTLLIVNPASAHGRTADEWLEIDRQARRLDARTRTVLTERAEHATALAREAIDGGTKRIVAVGGDGTVCEVVNGVMQADPARRGAAELAVISRGSGCDAGRTFGIPRETGAALAVAFRGDLRAIDIGCARARGPEGELLRYFVTIASVGLTADVAARAARSTKPLGAKVAYAWATLLAFRGYRNSMQRIEVDGSGLELVANNVIIGNGGYFAGGMRVLPAARPDDGLLDVLVWGDVSGFDFLRVLPRLYRGTHLDHPAATFLRGAEVGVSSGAELGVEVDGEVLGTTPASFTVVPAAIRLRVAGAGGRATP